MDLSRTDFVLQYILAAAGERQGGERELSTTQLVKYAYLADVAHAARHDGATYTGAPWTFSLQGPFAAELEARIAPVVRRVGATTRGALFMLEDDDLGQLRNAALALPAVVTGALQRAVRTFSRDPYGLLVHVYATAPMRRAAPGEAIDFTPTAPPEPAVALDPLPPLSPRARSALSARRAALTEVKTVTAPRHPPRYDDRYVDGQRALDASPHPLAACDGSLLIDDGVWRAPERQTRDVP